MELESYFLDRVKRWKNLSKTQSQPIGSSGPENPDFDDEWQH